MSSGQSFKASANLRGLRLVDAYRGRHARVHDSAHTIDLDDEGVGCIAFSPLAQGMLTDKYLHGIPESSRATRKESLSPDLLTEDALAKIRALREIAARRGQSLAQLALAWVLRDARVTSALIGVSSVEQLEANLAALDRLDFDADELTEIDRYATDAGINIWAQSSSDAGRPE